MQLFSSWHQFLHCGRCGLLFAGIILTVPQLVFSLQQPSSPATLHAPLSSTITVSCSFFILHSSTFKSTKETCHLTILAVHCSLSVPFPVFDQVFLQFSPLFFSFFFLFCVPVNFGLICLMIIRLAKYETTTTEVHLKQFSRKNLPSLMNAYTGRCCSLIVHAHAQVPILCDHAWKPFVIATLY